METLVLKFKSKKNYQFIKELASRLEDQKENSSHLKKSLPKSKLTAEDLKSMGSILKGQLISKEHLRSTAELIKELPKSKFKSEEHFLSYAGSMKGQYTSKAELRDRVWRKRA